MNVKWLDSISRQDLPTVGGKAANLGELVRLGLPVPPGFCLTTQAYAEQFRAWSMSEQIAPLLAEGHLDAASQLVADAFESHPLAPQLIDALLTAYRRMGQGPVAVRSSATAEDLSDASFAGQQETFLNVEGEEELLLAVRRCWASLWSPRALHYRQQRGIDHLQTQIAVLIQQMVPAEAAGVMFTVDPVAHRMDRMVVEAAPGLGEAIVSGQTGGEITYMSKDERGMLDRGTAHRERPVLTDAQLLELRAVGLRLESHFGLPQDVEFAVAGGRVFLLQARPVTTMESVEPEPIPPLGKLSFFQRLATSRFSERYHIAPKPLDNLVVSVVLEGSIRALSQMGLTFRRKTTDLMISQIWREGLTLPNPIPTPKFLIMPVPLVRLWNRDLVAWWEAGPHRRLVEACRPVDLGAMSDRGLLARVDHVRQEWLESMTERLVVTFSIYVIDALLRAVATLAVGLQGAPRVIGELLTGLPTKTTEVNQALWDLVQQARQAPEVAGAIGEGEFGKVGDLPGGAAFLERFEGFLAEYGHREGMTWYLWTPTWRQDPTQVWTMLRGLMPVAALPQSEGEEQLASAMNRVERKLRFVPGMTRLFRWLADRYRALHVFEEASHFDLTRPLDTLQQYVKESGRRLVARGLLDEPDEVHLLSYDMLRRWLIEQGPAREDARQYVARQRATYAVARGQWEARRFEARAEGGSELRGTGASPGIVRGTARIIRGEHEFHRLNQGEILVCPHTIPSWTPLFVSAAAVITEVGGVASHAAIVAREYRIPAVMGVSQATQRIMDGQELLVDGNTGRVVLSSTPGQASDKAS